MKEIKMRALFGILGLAGAGFLLSGVTSTVGCSSSSSGGSSGSTGSAGSTGHGGSTGTAGTTGSGGTSNTGTGGGGGGGGGGGSGPAAGCSVSDVAPGDPLIADFETADAGSPSLPIGGTYVYPMTGGPVATVVGGAWQVTYTTTANATMAQYWGAGIYMQGAVAADCIDATAHTGVQFDVKGVFTGSMTGCTVQYSTNDSAHADSTQTPVDPKAGGAAGSYSPQLDITAMLSAGGMTLKVPFVGTGAPSGGMPATGISKDKLTGVQWQLTTAMGSACVLTLTIDNVKFYD